MALTCRWSGQGSCFGCCGIAAFLAAITATWRNRISNASQWWSIGARRGNRTRLLLLGLLGLLGLLLLGLLGLLGLLLLLGLLGLLLLLLGLLGLLLLLMLLLLLLLLLLLGLLPIPAKPRPFCA